MSPFHYRHSCARKLSAPFSLKEHDSLFRVLITTFFFCIASFNCTSQTKEEISSFLKQPVTTQSIAEGSELIKNLCDKDPQQALQLGKDLLAKAGKIFSPYHKSLGPLYFRIGYAYDFAGILDSTLYYYNKALIIFENTKDKKNISAVYHNRGVAYYFTGKYQLALESLRTASALRLKNGDSLEYAKTEQNIGLIYMLLKLHNKAALSFEHALKIKERSADSASVLNTLQNLAVNYAESGDFENAVKYCKKCQQYARKAGNEKILHEINSIYALAFQKKGDLKTAEQYFLQNIKYLEQEADIHNGIDKEYVLLSKLYLQKKQYKEALDYAIKGFEIAKKNNLKMMVFNALEHLPECYARNGNYERAYFYMNELLSLNDSIYNTNLLTVTADLKTRYKIDSIQLATTANILLERKKNEVLIEISKRDRKNLIYLGVLVLLVILIAILLFFGYRRSKAGNTLLEGKNQEIKKQLEKNEMLMREIHHRVKNNLQMISSLLRIQSRYINGEEAIEALNKSQSRVNAMSVLHQFLYQEKNLESVSLEEYVRALTQNLGPLFQKENKAEIEQQVSDVRMDVEKLIPLGLILNEIISNCFKHAQPEGEVLKISIKTFRSENDLVVKVQDNGTVLNSLTAKESFGLRLIKSLSERIDATFGMYFANGTTSELTIKNYYSHV